MKLKVFKKISSKLLQEYGNGLQDEGWKIK